MNLKEAAQVCIEGRELPDDGIAGVVRDLLDGSVPDEDKAFFLEAFSNKGETPRELASFAREILPYAKLFPISGHFQNKPMIDCCGTGGGGVNMVNVSTGSMFIMAAGGVPVVKHGNRGMTKRSGSADVLDALGIRIDLSPEEALKSLEKIGMVFLFAPLYHPAFKSVASVRKALGAAGKKTVFNLLGPILNPARPSSQLIGVFREPYLELFHQALTLLGVKSHLVAYGLASDGAAIGEVSPNGKNILRGSVSGKDIKRLLLPGGFLSSEATGKLETLFVEDAQQSAARLMEVFEGKEKGLLLAMLAYNAGAGFYVQGRSETLEDGICLAYELIVSKKALKQVYSAQTLIF